MGDPEPGRDECRRPEGNAPRQATRADRAGKDEKTQSRCGSGTAGRTAHLGVHRRRAPASEQHPPFKRLLPDAPSGRAQLAPPVTVETDSGVDDMTLPPYLARSHEGAFHAVGAAKHRFDVRQEAVVFAFAFQIACFSPW
jgi:hypothetical protein